MRKIFTAITFAAGALFGMFFSPKKGEDARKAVSAKKSNEDKAEAVGEEAKALVQNFWKTVRGPLKKGLKDMEKEMKKQGKKYGSKAKVQLDEWKDMASDEMEKEVKKAKKQIKKTVKKAKSTAKKKISKAKKSVKKKK